ncbi:MAG: hypothetical protein HY962_03775 [Ignavibacteriae bacterium]|nr:hypothetical protein [Ignavibacteriota bacterium]
MPRRVMTCVIVLLAGIAAAAQAQEQAPDSARAAALTHDEAPAPERVMLGADSLALFERRGAAEALRRLPGMRVWELGSPGQPVWAGAFAATPYQGALLRDGATLRDPVTGFSDPYLLSIDETRRIVSWPAHQALWLAGPGVLSAVELESPDSAAPQPVTRLIHSEGSYDHLFTDVQFAMDPREGDRLRLGATRRTTGSNDYQNTARFPFTRAESWDLRGRYELRLSPSVLLTLSDYYNDHIVYMNGGMATPLAGTMFFPLYPGEDNNDFASSAFDPIFAELVNPTIRTRVTRNEAALGAVLQWDEGRHETRLTLTHTSNRREFSDRLAITIPLYDSTGAWTSDSAATLRHDLARTWNVTELRANHSSQLPWATLHLRGAAGLLTHDGWASASDEVLTARLGALLEVPLGFTRLSLFGSADKQAAGGGVGAGATLVFPSDIVSQWCGVSVARRASTIFERALDAHPLLSYRDPGREENETLLVGEAGLRAGGRVFETDLRLHARTVRSPYGIHVSEAGGIFLPVVTYGARTVRVFGAALQTRLTVHQFVWENHFDAITNDQAGDEARVASTPVWSNDAEIYYRGIIIDGTLRVKAGAGLTWRSAFAPALFDPSTGAFSTPYHTGRTSGAATFTDTYTARLFLFATIKDAATLHVVWDNITDTQSVTTGFHPMPGGELRFGVDWLLFD